MITISAVVRARRGHEETVRGALDAVARFVAANEPETVGYFVARSVEEPWIFVTYERFTDRAAMDRHNGSEAVQRFVAETDGALDGAVELRIAEELSAK